MLSGRKQVCLKLNYLYHGIYSLVGISGQEQVVRTFKITSPDVKGKANCAAPSNLANILPGVRYWKRESAQEELHLHI